MTNEPRPEGLPFEAPDGFIAIAYKLVKLRVLFSDGRVLDFEAVRDDSNIRGSMLELAKQHGAPDDVKIEGVATLPSDWSHE